MVFVDLDSDRIHVCEAEPCRPNKTCGASLHSLQLFFVASYVGSNRRSFREDRRGIEQLAAGRRFR